MFPHEVMNTYQNNRDNQNLINIVNNNITKGFKIYGEISKAL